MKRPFSLQRRLGLGLALGVTACWLAATLIAGVVVRHELDEAFDSALQETAQRILPLAFADITNRDADAPAPRSAAIGAHEEFLTYLVRDAEGELLLASHDADGAVFPARPALGFRDTDTHRLYGESAVSGSIIVEVAEPLAHRREAAFEAVLALFAPLLVLVPFSLGGAWWFVRHSMRPVLAFGAEIEARGAGDLSPVVADGLPVEVGPIAAAVNRLMERLRRGLEAERSFTANSAHELRTPIAASLAQAQRLLAEVPEGPVRERASRIETSLRHLARLAEKLMQLATAEGGGLLSETPQDLLVVLRHSVAEIAASTEGRDRVQLVASPAAALRSYMDPDAFDILVRNLVENALKHGATGGAVSVAVADQGVIRIVNAGAVVPPETLARLKHRFARGASDATGSGLGLAIAEVIATGAGARLELCSPASGRDDGFEAVLVVPLAMRSTPAGDDVV